MSRVRLHELQSYEFRARLHVRITDINIANHLGHVELIGMMHEARHQFFTEIGVSELRLGADNVGIVIIDLVINYLLEVFAGDIIDIDLQIDDMTERNFRVYYRLKRGDEIIALAETGIAPFIYGSKQAVPVPQVFTEALAVYRKNRTVG